MPWAEPLELVHTYNPRTLLVQWVLRDAKGQHCAAALARHTANRRWGIMGEIAVAKGATPAEARKALILIARDAGRLADELGLQRVHVDARGSMTPLVQRMFGKGPGGSRDVIAGPLHELRSALLETTNSRGEFKSGD